MRKPQNGKIKRVWYPREWMKQRGIIAARVADKADWKPRRVSEYLSGEKGCTVEALFGFAKALGLEHDPGALLRPPPSCEEIEINQLVSKMDGRQRKRALRHLRAVLAESEDERAA